MIRLEITNNEKKVQQENAKIDSIKDDNNSRCGTIELKISKINIKFNEVNKKIEDTIALQSPNILNLGRDEEEDKKRDERVKTQFDAAYERMDRISKEFQALVVHTRALSNQIDGKIAGKADIEMLKDLECIILNSENLQGI